MFVVLLCFFPLEDGHGVHIRHAGSVSHKAFILRRGQKLIDLLPRGLLATFLVRLSGHLLDNLALEVRSVLLVKVLS